MRVTAWRLVDPTGRLTECEVNERDRRWQVVIHKGHDIVTSERCASDDAALARADELWRDLRAQGWTDVPPSESRD